MALDTLFFMEASKMKLTDEKDKKEFREKHKEYILTYKDLTDKEIMDDLLQKGYSLSLIAEILTLKNRNSHITK